MNIQEFWRKPDSVPKDIVGKKKKSQPFVTEFPSPIKRDSVPFMRSKGHSKKDQLQYWIRKNSMVKR